MAAKTKKIIIYLLFIALGFGLGFFFGDFGRSDKIEVEKTEKIDRLAEATEKLETVININKMLKERIAKGDTVIFALRDSITTLDNILSTTYTELEKINEDYEKIDDVDDMDINERIRFFTEYFRRKTSQE